MGWCNGTYVFDRMVKKIFDLDAPVAVKEAVIVELIHSLWNNDWDCESDSDYWNDLFIRYCFKQADPDWYRDVFEGELSNNGF